MFTTPRRPRPLLPTLTAAALLVALGAASEVSAEETEKVLTVEYTKVGQICLEGKDLEDLKQRLKDLVIPEGKAVTIVAYSDATEFATRTRYTGPSPCIKRGVPKGIGNHERLSTLRAMQVTETAQGLGLVAFEGTPLLLLGADITYRQRDPNALAIVARRSEKSGPRDRRVEIWIADAMGTGANKGRPQTSGQPGRTLMLTPLLLPPEGYAAAGGGAPSAKGGAPSAEAFQPWEMLGWAMVSAGAASTVAGVFVLLHASDVDDRANSTLNVDRSIALNRQAADAWQSGGWAVGVGVGLGIFGTVMVLSVPDGEGGETTLRLTPGAGDGLGIGLSLETTAF